MKPKYLITSLFVAFLFLASSSSAFADCQIANWDPNSRNLQVCVGQFNSPAQLRSTTAHFNCLNNSNMLPGGVCRDNNGNELKPADYPLSSIPDSQIAQDGSGKYYTCITGQTLNRGIGQMNVSFSGGQDCTTNDVVTKPSDWNPLTEGLPWQQSQNVANSSGAVECTVNGTKGINTALGCISYDATSGGFIKSLLTIAIGLGGGVALLLILYGVFIVTTSAGIPEKLKSGNEIITSAVAGLLFIIMAIFLMNLIGIKILALPGLQ